MHIQTPNSFGCHRDPAARETRADVQGCDPSRMPRWADAHKPDRRDTRAYDLAGHGLTLEQDRETLSSKYLV